LIQINPRRILSVVYGPYRIRDSLHLDMSTLDNAASPPIRRDETVRIALLLAFAGGYLDAHTWILHGVLANAQTANLIFLWVHGMAGEWEKAAHFIPPIVAFAVGIVGAAWLRHAAGDRAGAISALIEIVLLVVESGTLRLSGIFAALCVAFGIGAAVGAYATERTPDLALVLPVAALLTVLLHRKV